MSKFKVSDRVAVYEHNVRVVGTVFKIDPTRNNGILIEDPDPPTAGVIKVYHPNVCRKIKAGKRRRIWVTHRDMAEANIHGGPYVPYYKVSVVPVEGSIEFVEVRRKE